MEDTKPDLKLVGSGEPGIRLPLVPEPLRVEHPRLNGVALFIRPLDELRYKRVCTPAIEAWRAHWIAEATKQPTEPPIKESETVLRTLVVGWEGILDEKGQPIPFTKDENSEASPEALEMIQRPAFGYVKHFNYPDPEKPGQEAEGEVRRMWVHVILDSVGTTIKDSAEGKASPQP